MLAASLQAQHRATARILAHCDALGRLTVQRSGPQERLEALVGAELAHVLVHGLAGARVELARR